MNAYQIVDFDNPTSVQYYQYSVQSLRPVADLLNIEQVQCITPKTLPSGILGDDKKRSETEKAALVSQYLLIKRIAQGERLIVMEHDAYLRPGFEQTFRDAFVLIDQTALWVPGIACECYTMNQRVAQIFCDLFERDSQHGVRGPLAMMFEAGREYCKKVGGQVLWPLYAKENNNYNKSCLASTPDDAHHGRGKILDAAITQHVDETAGVTIKRNKQINRKNNPNVHFT